MEGIFKLVAYCNTWTSDEDQHNANGVISSTTYMFKGIITYFLHDSLNQGSLEVSLLPSESDTVS